MTISPGWTPSAARTVAPAVAANSSLRGITVAAVAPAWPAKASVELLDYTVDMTNWLADASDTLLGVDVSTSPNASALDLAVLWSSVISNNATLFLGAGQPNASYVVSVQIRTKAGRVALFDITLPITADAAVTPIAQHAALAPNILLDASGTVLFLCAATPLLLA